MAGTATKQRLNPDQVVERLAMLLCDDPSNAVAVEEIYRRYKDTNERRLALRDLFVRRGRPVPTWA